MEKSLPHGTQPWSLRSGPASRRRPHQLWAAEDDLRGRCFLSCTWTELALSTTRSRFWATRYAPRATDADRKKVFTRRARVRRMDPPDMLRNYVGFSRTQLELKGDDVDESHGGGTTQGSCLQEAAALAARQIPRVCSHCLPESFLRGSAPNAALESGYLSVGRTTSPGARGRFASVCPAFDRLCARLPDRLDCS